MTSESTASWQGGGYRLAAKILFATGAVGVVISGSARSGFALLVFAVLPLVAGVVLFVLSSTIRREQVRLWEDYRAGRASIPASRALAVTAIVLGMLVPPAVTLTLRIPLGCGVFNIFGLPWAPEIQAPVQIACLVVAGAGMFLIFGGLENPRMQSVCSALVRMWAIVSPIAFVVFFLSVYGDPGPGGCRAG